MRMKLTQKEIVTIRKELDAELILLEAHKENAMRKLRTLQGHCAHPKARRIGPMGMEKRCPDCKWQE